MTLFAWPTWLVLSWETDTAPTFALDLDEDALVEAEKERKLVCKRCGKLITYSDEAIQIQGSHEHTRVNPNGLEFTFGCFRTAQGCAHSGQDTEQFTWFTRYQWCIAACSNCWEHLGWRFHNGEQFFHGLILAKITHPRP